jgi:AbrB family looped-hinge helix DNA binding protein
MPIAVLTSKGQMTIPKEVRKALDLKPSGKVIIIVDGDQAILKPLRGNILDIGGSIEMPGSEKPVDFRRIREETRKKVAGKWPRGGDPTKKRGYFLGAKCRIHTNMLERIKYAGLKIGVGAVREPPLRIRAASAFSPECGRGRSAVHYQLN